MGIDHAQSFLRKVKEDPALQEKFTQMHQEHYQRLQEEIIATGSKAGLEFTSEELNEAVKQHHNERTADITEAELDSIAGGTISTPTLFIC